MSHHNISTIKDFVQSTTKGFVIPVAGELAVDLRLTKKLPRRRENRLFLDDVFVVKVQASALPQPPTRDDVG
ncbi:MAG: hypothetical protein ACREP9_08615 [Candidatus Dormibacteraceae bacterium]